MNTNTNTNLNKTTRILFLLSFLIFLFGTGYKIGEYKTKQALINNKALGSPGINNQIINQNPKKIDFSLFWDTWDKVEKKFVDKNKIDYKKMYYGAIKGMVASLDDPYTFFLTPEENKQSKDDLEGKFEGIGAQLGLKNNQIVVIAPLKDSPAERAGVKAGDLIIKVNDQSTEKWTLTEAVSKIRGPQGTKVKLTLERDGKQFVITITREKIFVPSVELSFEKNVAVLKLTRFGDDTNNEWSKTINQISNKWQRKEIKGMVLDLRDNPGGYLEGAVYVASEFLPMGKIVVEQRYMNNESQKYRVLRFGKLQDIPLVVLINKGSASASEIVAGSLRDYQRAKIIGEKSFGKGSVQEALDLKDKAGLHVTVAKWILPKGDWINSKGIEPQIKVENEIKEGDTLTRENDKQLDRAIEELLK